MKKSSLIFLGITLLVLLNARVRGESEYHSKLDDLFGPNGYKAPSVEWHPPVISWPQISERLKEGQTIQEVVALIPFYFTIRRGPGSGGTGSVVFYSEVYGPQIWCTFIHENGVLINHQLWDRQPPNPLMTSLNAVTYSAFAHSVTTQLMPDR